MPQVTVYVRAEDLEKWKAIKSKSEFLSRALNDTPLVPKKPREAPRVPKIPGVTTADKIKPVSYQKKGSWGA